MRVVRSDEWGGGVCGEERAEGELEWKREERELEKGGGKEMRRREWTEETKVEREVGKERWKGSENGKIFCGARGDLMRSKT